MKVLLLCGLLFLLVIAGLIFWDDYGRLYIHEQHLRKEDTQFHQLVCTNDTVALGTGSTARCHGIKDRHALSIQEVALRKAIDQHAQYLKTLFLDSTILLIVVASVMGIALCLRLLTFLHPPKTMQFPPSLSPAGYMSQETTDNGGNPLKKTV